MSIVHTRLLLSGGVLTGANEANAIATVVPVVAFGRQDEWLSIDIGGGGAVLSDHKFGTQNFGGPIQFVWTFGVNLGLFGPMGVGYHFQHYSDAALYGGDARGVSVLNALCAKTLTSFLSARSGSGTSRRYYWNWELKPIPLAE